MAGQAGQACKPLFLYFYKKATVSFGGSRKKRKDKELDACQKMQKEFKMRALTNILREFHCARVNVAEADRNMLKKYRVRRVPFFVLVDLDGRIAWRQMGEFKWSKVEKILLRLLKKADAKVKKLAKGKDDDPMTARARARLKEIEARDTYAKGEKYYLRAQWDKARGAFQKVVSSGLDKNYYVLRSGVMLEEIAAAKLFFEAEADARRKNYAGAKEKLEKILAEFKKATSFRKFAREELQKVKAKLNKKKR